MAKAQARQTISVKRCLPGQQTADGGRRAKRDNGVLLGELFFNFLRDSTAHGLPRVVTSESWPRKLFWLFVFVIAFGYFIYQCVILAQYYFRYPVSVRINVETSKKITFPAVTVCNINMLKKGEAKKDPRYKELVSIDQFMKYNLNVTVGAPTGSERAKREISDTERSKSEGGYRASGRPSGSTTAPHQARTAEYGKDTDQLAYEILKAANPDIGDVLPRLLRHQEPEIHDDSREEDIRNEGLLPAPAGARRSRDRRQAIDSSGDYYWDTWYDAGSGEYPYYSYNANYDDGDDYYDYGDEFQYQDYGFAGKVKNDFAFRQFMKASKTNDYSDLVDVLKPTKEDLDTYGHQASDLILQCSFNKLNCSYLDFRKVYNPTYGLCYVFNDALGNSTVRTTNKFGSRYGLRLTLDIEYEQYLGLFSHKAGARLLVHPNDITAFPEDFGVSAMPGQETEIGVSLETIRRQPAPYPSNCTDGSKHRLSYEGRYTIAACMMTCLQANLKKKCGCVDRLVVNSSVTRCSTVNKTHETCRQRIYHLYDEDKLGCECPPSCQEEVYKTYTSSSEWPSAPYKYLLAWSLRKEGDQTSADEILDRTKTTMLAVHVYLENPIMVSITEDPAYTWDRLLAGIGGLLGLFIGVSACTVVELLEFLVDAAVGALKLALRKRKSSVTFLDQGEPRSGTIVTTGHF